MAESGTNPAELRDGDRIMVHTMAGVVVDVAEHAFWLDTGHGTRQYPKTAPWRRVADRESCQHLLERWCAELENSGDDADPGIDIPVGLDAPEEEAGPIFAALPLEQKVELLRIAQRNPEQLPERVGHVVWRNNGAIYGELAVGLGVSTRMLQSAARRGDAAMEGLQAPREFTDHIYLGAFQVGDRLLACDPCNVDQNQATLINRTSATPGTWHAYVRYPTGQFEDSVAMMAIHEDHLDRAIERGTKLRSFGVASGCAAIVSADALKDPDAVALMKDGDRWSEGTFGDYGCTTRTLNGDGVYDSLVLRVDKRAVMVRLNLSGNPDHSHFRSVAATRAISDEHKRREQLAADIAEAEAGGGAEMRNYSISETFSEGQIIRHPTFGDGRVAKVMSGKIEVQFRERPRVLIHGRVKRG